MLPSSSEPSLQVPAYSPFHRLIIVFLIQTPASNVTGALADVHAVTAVLHAHSALAGAPCSSMRDFIIAVAYVFVSAYIIVIFADHPCHH